MVDGRCCFTPPTASSHLVRFALSYFSQILSEWRENKIQKIVRLLFYFRSDQFTQSAFAIDIYKTDNGQQISLILPPLFFLILHKHLVRFLVFSFGCLLCVLNAPDFGASITKVLEDLIPATLDSYLQRRRGGTGRQDYTHTHTRTVSSFVCIFRCQNEARYLRGNKRRRAALFDGQKVVTRLVCYKAGIQVIRYHEGQRSSTRLMGHQLLK